MIIVIADDITGAAEMAGIALRYGLQTIVSDDLIIGNDAELLVVYTNTRSMSRHEAIDVMSKLTAKARSLKPSLFYKKTDSVLRGHVLAEMNAQRKALGVQKGLLVPVNPALGRVIREGKYYVHDQPVHETSFSQDPEFPINSSRVEEMLADDEVSVRVVSKPGESGWTGIAVGEASTVEDVQRWANASNDSTLLAGGGSFFNALLERQFKEHEELRRRTSPLALPILLVSGTTYQRNVQRIGEYLPIVSYMPAEIFSAGRGENVSFDYWVEEVMQKLKQKEKAIIAIDNSAGNKGNADLLRERIAELTKRVVAKTPVAELLIEGGSVAYSIVNKLEWKAFIPTEELAQGIVRMQVMHGDNIHLTIKPGSYDWPAEWNFN